MNGSGATVPGVERRLLFTFSSVIEEETRAFLQEQNLPVLSKPFEIADLIVQVRNLAQKQEKAALKGSDEKALTASAGN